MLANFANPTCLLMGVGVIVSVSILAASAYLPLWRGASSFPLNTTTPNSSTLANDAIVPGESLVFRYGIGSGLTGFDTLEVCGNGDTRFQFCERCFEQPREARFQLPSESVADLCQRLRDMEFADMPDAYHANVHDGTQIILTLQVNSQMKRVYLNNHFPASVKSLIAYIDQQLLVTVQSELNQSQPIDRADIIDLSAADTEVELVGR